MTTAPGLKGQFCSDKQKMNEGWLQKEADDSGLYRNNVMEICFITYFEFKCRTCITNAFSLIEGVLLYGRIYNFGFNKNGHNFQFSYNIPNVMFFSDAIFHV